MHPYKCFFVGTEENSNRVPSLPLLIYLSYLQQIIYPLSLIFVSEQRTVSHPELLTEYFMKKKNVTEGLYW